MSRLFALFFMLLCCMGSSHAREAAPNSASVRDILEQEEAAAKLLESKGNAIEAQREDAPLNTMLGLRGALRVGDWNLAVQYQDTRYRPEPVASQAPAELARQLVASGREEDRWPFLDLSDDGKEQHRGSVDYPARGPA